MVSELVCQYAGLVGRARLTHCGGGSLKSQMKKADRSGARYTLLLGEQELENEQVVIKDMSGLSEQVQVEIAALSGYMNSLIGNQQI